MVAAANPATTIDEGVEHHVEELAAELEGGLLRAGGGFARSLAQSIGETGTGEAEE